MSIEDDFHRWFGRAPEFVATSPGRINLIGEHIDYLDGEVMPIAIDRHVHLAAAANGTERCAVYPAEFGLGTPATIDLADLSRRTDPSETWLNYIVGVLAGYREAGVKISGFDAVIRSTLPTGAGLSSSAALETASALAVEALSKVEQDVVDRALLCQRAEHEYAGVPCGIMDQLAVGAGRKDQVLLLDCRDLSFQFRAIPEGISVLTADTGVKHALGDGEYRKRREDCEEALRILGADSFRGMDAGCVESARGQLGDRLYRRSRHAVSEMERVKQFAGALERSDVEALGLAMRASHESLRYDYEVSCEELDSLVEAAYEFGFARGLVGSRMTGGGFGGSTVSLVRTEAAGTLRVHLENTYREKFGCELNCFITRPVDGARVRRAG